MNRSTIKELALSMGFSLKKQPNGELDLNPYVYDFAAEVIQKARNHVTVTINPDDPAEDYDLALASFTFAIQVKDKNQ